MKKVILAAIMAFVVVTMAVAVPAKPGVRVYTQPDGTTVSVEMFGDENFHYTKTTDGYLVVMSEDGWFEYAKVTNKGAFKSTGIKAKDAQYRTAKEDSKLKRIGQFTPERVKKAVENRRKQQQRVNKTRGQQRSFAAPQADRGLVILVSFNNLEMTKTRQDFDDLLNKEGYSENDALGSARDYYREASFGKFNPHFDVYGPYVLDQRFQYYGRNSSLTGNDERVSQMIIDAVTKLAEDEEADVNFADYDSNNDGKIDNVFVYYAGWGEQAGGGSNYVWPHRSTIDTYILEPGSKTEFDGKRVHDYACSCELQGTAGYKMSGIGVFVHEFSHVLGLPDLYSTDNGGTRKNFGYWDVMDVGPYNRNETAPPTYSGFERMFLGWTTPVLLSEPDNGILENLYDSNKCYLISSTGEHNLDGKNPSPDEFFILENRQQTRWDVGIPGHGMLITRVRYIPANWDNNTVNAKDDPDIDLIEADGVIGDIYDMYGKEGDAFPGSENVTKFTPYPGMTITNIKESKGVITFTFKEGRQAGIYNVYLHTMGHGVVDVNSITMSAPGQPVTLPAVNADNGFTFLGWAKSADASEADAGKAGDSFLPTADCTLYALYSDNTAVETTFADEIQLIRNRETGSVMLIDIPMGAKIECFDALGRMLVNTTAYSTSMSLNIPKGFFLVRVSHNGETAIIKGI